MLFCGWTLCWVLGASPLPPVEPLAQAETALHASSQDSAEMRRFARKLTRAIAKAYPGRKMVYEADRERLTDPASSLVIHLTNLYRDYEGVPLRERKAWLERVAKQLGYVEIQLPTFEEVQDLLTPKMWSRGKLEWMRLQNQLDPRSGGQEPLLPPRWALGEHLIGALAIDGDDLIQYANEDMRLAWEKELPELVKLAEARVPQLGMGWSSMGTAKGEGGAGRLFSILGDDYFAASHLLDYEQLRKFSLADGSLAAAPSRETLLIVEPGDPELLALFVEQIEKAFANGQRPLCPIPLEYRQGAWHPWTPPADHPHRVALGNLEREYLAGEYHGQGEQLDAAFLRQGLDLYVAGYFLQEEEGTGELLSTAVWTRTVDTFLPQADYIAFVDPEQPEDEQYMGSVRWEDLQAQFGQLLEKDPERYPARYRTRGYPDLAALGDLLIAPSVDEEPR